MSTPARRAAVLGSPIAHSRSPLLHRAAYAALGLDWTYDAIDITPERLPEFLSGCSSPEWAGLSLTMPLKTAVLPLLDEASDLVRLVGAANTVVIDAGSRIGHNTDVAGMRRALEEAAEGTIAVRRGCVIGGGATARSALAALESMGAREIDVVVRNLDRAQDVLDLGSALGIDVKLIAWDAVTSLDGEVTVATVPPGAADALVGLVPSAPGVLLDVAYGHDRSLLANAWDAAGGTVAEGLDLLLWQAVDQVHLMTGLEAPIDAMRAALAQAPE